MLGGLPSRERDYAVSFTSEREFAVDSASVGRARQFVSACVIAGLNPAGWGLADDAALAVSELMTAAIECGCRRARVRVDQQADRLRISVMADGALLPRDWATVAVHRAAVLQAVTVGLALERLDGSLRWTATLAVDPAHTGTR